MILVSIFEAFIKAPWEHFCSKIRSAPACHFRTCMFPPHVLALACVLPLDLLLGHWAAARRLGVVAGCVVENANVFQGHPEAPEWHRRTKTLASGWPTIWFGSALTTIK